MDEMKTLAKKIEDDIKEIKQHDSFKPFLGFSYRIVSSPSQGGNIRLPKKLKITASK